MGALSSTQMKCIIHSSHKKDHAWFDDKSAVYWYLSPKDSKLSSYLLAVKVLLMFKLGTRSGDYHHEINFDNCKTWLKIELIPNFLLNMVLAVDNTAYHNVQLVCLQLFHLKKVL